MIYVLNVENKPLMPCNEAKARRLLKGGRAKIVRYEPFTIQLLFNCEDRIQKCNIGVDCGSKNIGLSVVSESGNILYMAEAQLRQDIRDNIELRKRLRHARRGRKTRYRPRRFLNRKTTQIITAPSVRSRINSHINLIKSIIKILPINLIRIEISKFSSSSKYSGDIQIDCKDQKGDWSCHYKNIRTDIICSDKMNIDHIIPKSAGGTNRKDNLVICCSAHNQAKSNLSYKDFTGIDSPNLSNLNNREFMNMLGKYLVPQLGQLAPIEIINGKDTKKTRELWKINKSHINDSIVIAGIIPIKKSCKEIILKQCRKKKRQLHEAVPKKGRKTANITSKRNNKNVKCRDGFYLNDKVIALGQYGFISGFSKGCCYVKNINDKYIRTEDDKYNMVYFSNIKRINHNNNWQLFFKDKF